MEYKVSELAGQYAKNLADKEIDIQSPPVPTFNIDAYNEYEYLCCMQEINDVFDKIEDLYVTETFLKGE